MRIDDCVSSVLKKLKTDYKLRIVSIFPHKLALLTTLKRFDLSRFFEAIVVSAQLGARKPNPKIFEETLRTLNAKAFGTVSVGDALRQIFLVLIM